MLALALPLTATAQATTIAVSSGADQTGDPGATLAPFVVFVTDAADTPVSGTTVTFAITGGGGTLSSGVATADVTADANGQASATLTLGSTAGTNTVTATVSGLTGSPVTFVADGVDIVPDAGLRGAIETALGKEAGDPIASAEIGTLTQLIAESAGISNLAGLQFATNLTVLNLQENSISDLVPLVNLASLTELNLEDNSISDLSPLANLTNLTVLNLEDNSISDLSPLANLTSLRQLYLYYNSISDLSHLANLTSLRQLYLYNNSISDLSPLANLTSLTWLFVGGNSISDLSVLANLTKLGSLSLQDNSISDLSPLANLTNLRFLSLRSNSISDLSHLGNLTSLTWLILEDNSISDVSPLANLANLTSLNLKYNSISDVSPLTNLTSLRSLSLRDNSISDISALSGLTSLTSLILQDNSISDISALSGLTNLTLLYLRGNSIWDLSPLANLTSLRSLGLEYNSISDLSPLANLTSLTSLFLGGNSISDLSPLANLTSLTRLFLYRNSISDLSSLANLTSLIELYLYQNSISDVSPLANLTNLTWLYLWDNSISDVSPLTNLTSLTRLYLTGNSISDVSPLANLASLTWLILEDNSISDLPSLANLTNLTRLSLGGNSISDLVPLAGLISLTSLSLEDNSISDLSPLANLTNLTRLLLTGNSISDVSSLAGLTSLRSLGLEDNSISDLSPLANLTSLRSLGLEDNSISDLSPLANLTSLTWLSLGHNSISDLSPLVANTGLDSGDQVHVTGNPLSYASINTYIPALQARGVELTFDNCIVQAVVKISGDDPQQQGVANTALGAPFVVEVQDGNGVTFEGVPVAFAVTVGGGSLSIEDATTDAQGRAESVLTLGPDVGTNTVEVSVTGIADTVSFTASAVSPPFGEQFGGGEEIPSVPKGTWTPDRLSRAEYTHAGEETTIRFRHGGRMEEHGVTYTCMSSEGCRIEGTSVSMGAVRVSERAADEELMSAGVAQLVDDQTEFQDAIYNGYELKESTVTLRSEAGESTRVSFLDPDGDLVFVDFSSDDPATEVVITLEGFSGTLEESPYDQPEMSYAQGLATVTMINATEHTWLRVVSLGNHIHRVDLALIEEDTFAGAVDGIADIKAVVIEGEASIGVIDAANANFVGSSGEVGIDAAETMVKRALSIGDIMPSAGTTPVLRISGASLDPANVGVDEKVVDELWITGGDLREATGALQIDTGGVAYGFFIVAVGGERSIRNSELRPDLGDGVLEAVTDTFVAEPNDYFVTDGQKTKLMSE